jgi:hypothetical protein
MVKGLLVNRLLVKTTVGQSTVGQTTVGQTVFGQTTLGHADVHRMLPAIHPNNQSKLLSNFLQLSFINPRRKTISIDTKNA